MKQNRYKTLAKTKGFSAIESTVAILIVAVIGGGGWYLWGKSKDESASTSNDSSSQADNADPPGSEGGKYLVIEGWGVRFPLPEELRGDIYVSAIEKGVTESPSTAYDPETPVPSERISFGSKKLDELAGRDGYSLDTLVFIERTSQGYPEKATPYKLKDFEAFDGTWFTLRDYKPGEIDIAGYGTHLSEIYDRLIEAIQKMERI